MSQLSSVKYDIDWKKSDLEPTEAPLLIIDEPPEFVSIVTEYDEVYCKAIIRHCQQGGSVESFSGLEYIDPDAMVKWCDKYPKFKAAVKIAMSGEYLYWEQLCKIARERPDQFKDILPTINRKLAQLESTLARNGLRKSMYQYEEEKSMTQDKLDELAAIEAMEDL